MDVTTKAILLRAADLVERPGAWLPDAWDRDDRICSSAAVVKAGKELGAAWATIVEALGIHGNYYWREFGVCNSDWEGAAGRTLAEVVNALRKSSETQLNMRRARAAIAQSMGAN